MNQLSRRGPWLPEEDNSLIDLVRTQGPNNWVRISQQLQHRTPKQCRERYHQNLKPSLNHEPISAQEGEVIEQLVDEMGKRWAEIARRLGNRSDNAVKNWWNGSMNRRKRNSSHGASGKQIGNRLHPIPMSRMHRTHCGLPPNVVMNCGDLPEGSTFTPNRWSAPEPTTTTNQAPPSVIGLHSSSETNLLATTSMYSRSQAYTDPHEWERSTTSREPSVTFQRLPSLQLPPLTHQQISSNQRMEKLSISPAISDYSLPASSHLTPSLTSDTISNHSTPLQSLVSPSQTSPSTKERQDNSRWIHDTNVSRCQNINLGASGISGNPAMVIANQTSMPDCENRTTYPLGQMRTGLCHTGTVAFDQNTRQDSRMQLSNLVQ